jgi:hypothetical protein
MISPLRRRLLVPAFASVILCFGVGHDSWAQKKKPAPVQSGTPTLNFALPLGCQRGAVQEVIFTGSNIAPAVQFWAAFPCINEILPDEKLAAEGKVKVLLAAPAETPIGLYPIRILSAAGLTNMRLFAVDELPQIVDNGANHDKAKPQEVSAPCVVAGRTDVDVSDFYKISVKAGQRLSFEILGRRLGSPIDPLISLYGSKSLHEIAHDNDSPGSQGDPRLRHTFKEAGDYLIEVRDVLGRGGADFVYRLRIGDFPLATVPVPMAAKAGSRVQVNFAGKHVEGVKPVEVAVPNEPAGSVVWVVPKAGGPSGWPVPLVVSDIDEIVEQEPNQNAGEATRLPMPGGATGRFMPGDLVDDYVVSLKKGQKIAVEAQTLEWGSPTLAYLTVKNAKSGADLAKSNPMAPSPADQRLEYTAAEDGDVIIEVQHLLYQGGPAEAYHLSVRPVAPSLEVILASEKAEAAAGALSALPFTVVRKNFAGPVEVRVRGGDDSTVAKLKPSQNAGVLLFPSQTGTPLGARFVAIEATAVIGGKTVSVPAHARPSVSKALADLVFPPLDLPTKITVAIKGKAPFTLAARLEPADASPGSAPSLIVTATREPGFTEEIIINPPVGLPANAGAKVTPIAKDKNETKFPLDINAKVAAGEYYLLITGKSKADKREVISDPALLPLLITAPFDLAVEPTTLDLAPGAKAKVTVKATRKHGYKGAIAVEIKNLPAKVTGGKGSLNADQNSIDLELAAAADASPVDRAELELVGSATALNNLQRTGPVVVLRIAKK